MLRSIDVSTSVYAAIWAARGDGEETESQILERILTAKPISSDRKPETKVANFGFFDRRNMVDFPAGFRIEREYKGKLYAAEARDGKWVRLDSGKGYRSLNQLNASIAAGAENVWNGSWTYTDAHGRVRSINHLRK
ncbi:hypothetical protein [Sphingomonas sp. SUN039]|uniref:hypothetical protein n=1 Tax=Sphingomonas sp. SUN039 TaxID=2937787 RepID=UPI002164D8F4|nr:hypothetical protein [Sphingomonas sp. SUN039]UVO54185.1 hypothetical protein M0209_08645 [Sphingomonas sp. SUN039]